MAPSAEMTWSHSGKEEVDLLDVLLEGRVGGGVGVDVKGGAQALAGVESNVGGGDGGFAVGADGRLLAGLEDGLGRKGERFVIARLRRQHERRQRLHAQEADDEDGAEQEAKCGGDVEDATEPLPALALRIVKNRFIHGLEFAGRDLSCLGTILAYLEPRYGRGILMG